MYFFKFSFSSIFNISNVFCYINILIGIKKKRRNFFYSCITFCTCTEYNPKRNGRYEISLNKGRALYVIIKYFHGSNGSYVHSWSPFLVKKLFYTCIESIAIVLWHFAPASSFHILFIGKEMFVFLLWTVKKYFKILIDWKILRFLFYMFFFSFFFSVFYIHFIEKISS